MSANQIYVYETGGRCDHPLRFCWLKRFRTLANPTAGVAFGCPMRCAAAVSMAVTGDRQQEIQGFGCRAAPGLCAKVPTATSSVPLMKASCARGQEGASSFRRSPLDGWSLSQPSFRSRIRSQLRSRQQSLPRCEALRRDAILLRASLSLIWPIGAARWLLDRIAHGSSLTRLMLRGTCCSATSAAA